MPLFSGRLKRKNASASSTNTAESVTYSYNLYVLNLVELSEVYEDMLEKSFEAREQSHHDKFLKLLLESHSMLQSKYFEILHKSLNYHNELDHLRTELELHSYTELLYRSFGQLGDAYHAMRQLDSSANCYANSDRPLSYAVRMLEQSPRALMLYLEEVMFDASKCGIVHHDEHIGNMVLSLYRQYSPHRLSTLVLESSLKLYSRELAISLLQDLTGQSDSQSNVHANDTQFDARSPGPHLNMMMWNEVRPKDAFVLGLLYLDIGMVERAVQSFHTIEAHCVIEFCVVNHHLLQTDSKPSTLAVLLREHFVWCLLECLVRLREKISPQTAMDLLYRESDTAQDNRLLKQLYLTSMVCSECPLVVKDSRMTTLFMQHFVDELYEISESSQQRVSRSSNLLSERSIQSLMEVRQWCTFLQFSLIQFRHRWLSLIEHDTAAMVDSWLQHDRDNVSHDVKSAESNSIIQRRRKNSREQASDDSASFPDEELDPLDIFNRLSFADKTFFALSQGVDSPTYIMYILYSAQGLLCCERTAHSYKSLLQTIAMEKEEMEEADGSRVPHTQLYPGQLTLLVLCMTAMRQLSRAFRLMLLVQPGVVFMYASQYCKNLGDWKILVDTLLASVRVRTEDGDDNGSPVSTLHRPILERTLWHLSTQLKPDQFLSLLPRDGNSRYFMPFISRCFAHQTTHGLVNRLLMVDTMDTSQHQAASDK